mgnify:CR=1 FL=1
MKKGYASCISQIFCCAKIGKKKRILGVTRGRGQRQIRRRRTSHKRRYKNKNQRDGMRGAIRKRFSANAPPVGALFSCFLIVLRGFRRVLVSAPEARSAEGDGRRQPPVSAAADLYQDKHTPNCHLPFFGFFYAFRACIFAPFFA